MLNKNAISQFQLAYLFTYKFQKYFHDKINLKQERKKQLCPYYH